MTFKELLDQLQKLTSEQLQQEVQFVKYGAGSEDSWSGLAEDTYSEDSKRVRFTVADDDGVWYFDNEYSDGITDELDLSKIEEYGDAVELIVPANMPYFAIYESEDEAKGFSGEGPM
jgi:hypothetical protein